MVDVRYALNVEKVQSVTNIGIYLIMKRKDLLKSILNESNRIDEIVSGKDEVKKTFRRLNELLSNFTSITRQLPESNEFRKNVKDYTDAIDTVIASMPDADKKRHREVISEYKNAITDTLNVISKLTETKSKFIQARDSAKNLLEYYNSLEK